MKEYLDRRLSSLATKDDIEKMRQETKAHFRQWREDDKTNVAELRKETQTVVDQSNQVLASSLQQIKEVESLRDEMKQMAEMIMALSGKVSEGFVERKGEAAPATTASFADLEMRIRELEARLKTLEKMVLP